MIIARLDVVKVFSATKSQQRSELGDRVTEWLRTNPALRIVEAVVLQSSDEQFHCLSIVLLCTVRCDSEQGR